MVSVAWVVKRQDTAEKTPGPSSARGVTVLPDAAAQAEKGPGVFSGQRVRGSSTSGGVASARKERFGSARWSSWYMSQATFR